MPTLTEYLQAAETALTTQLANVTNRQAVPAHLRTTEQGILQALQAAMQLNPNSPAWQAVTCLEQLMQAPANYARNPASGNQSAYLHDLHTVLNIVRDARQQAASQPAPAPAGRQPAPTNRAAWTLDEWQQHDSAGLARMVQTNSPTFRALYKQHYGHEYTAPGTHNKPA